LSSAPESSPQRRGLGRGLEVLIGGNPVPSELLEIPVDAIHPNPRQPRRRFEPEAASGLAESVRRQGVIQPLLVRPRGVGGYEIVAGERRWRAAREAGRATVPAVVRTADDRDTLLLGLVENVAREQLTPIEEARAYAVLIDEFSLSLGEVAERHARAVLAVPDQEGRRRLAREIVRRGLSVRAAEQRAKWAGARQRPRTRSVPVDPALADRVRTAVEQLIGRHARVVPGRVELPFGDEHDLAELAEAVENAVATMRPRAGD
jgi:ParB family transcriptional regulator, chromosome partitioning protein